MLQHWLLELQGLSVGRQEGVAICEAAMFEGR